MNNKRITTRYATLTTTTPGGVTLKEEVVPVLFDDNNSSDEPQFAYATFATEGDSNQVTVTTLTPEQQQELLNQTVGEHTQIIEMDYNQPKVIRQHNQQTNQTIAYQTNSNIIIEELIEGAEEEINEDQLLEGKELIIDENGQTFTIHHLVTENGSPLTEVETLDEIDEDGQTILHILPAETDEGVEELEVSDNVESEMCIDESGNVIRVLRTEEVVGGLNNESEESEIDPNQQDDNVITISDNDTNHASGAIISILTDLNSANEDSLGVSTLGCSTGAEDNEDEEEFEISEITLGDPSLSDSRNANKSYYCPNCGNCYSAAGSLKLHMRACLRKRTEIPKEERYCNICQKTFNSVSYLKVHMLRHSGNGPKRCTRCYRKFPDEVKWKQHMDQHEQQDKLDAEAEALSAQHGDKKIVVKEFTCSFCSQNFTVVFELGQVKRRYACDPCREKYSNAEMLKQHKQMIEEKREFHCERCGRRFVFEGFLQRHIPTCDGTIKRRRDMK